MALVYSENYIKSVKKGNIEYQVRDTVAEAAINVIQGDASQKGSILNAKEEAMTFARTYADSLAPNYDVAGSAAAAQSSAQSYADSLAPNYDTAGSAAAAQTAAQTYADSLAPNYDTVGSAAAAQNAAQTYAKGLIDNVLGEDSAATTLNSLKEVIQELNDPANAEGITGTFIDTVKADLTGLTKVTYYTEADAAEANLELPGAWPYNKVKIEGVDPVPASWEFNGITYDADPTYANSSLYDYIYDEASWNESFQNGALKLYYDQYPNEDLWNPTAHRAANFNDAVYAAEIYSDSEGLNKISDANFQAGWGERFQSITDGGTTYYITMSATIGDDTIYEAFSDANGEMTANVYVKLLSKSYPNCTQCWEGAISAPGAKFPWIAPHFEEGLEGVGASIIFKYEGKDDVRPWRNAKIFGNGNGHKRWGAASVATEFGDESFTIPANSGTDTPSTFDVSKFKLILIDAVTGKETESNSYDYIYDEASWDESFQHGALHIYYTQYPEEDLWNVVSHRSANFNDVVWYAELYSDMEGTTQTGTAKYKATWGDPSQLLTDITDVTKKYYVNGSAGVDGNVYEMFLDSARTQSAGIFLKFTNKTYPNCTQCWEGAVSAPGAKYPWIAPHFDTDVNAILRFEYEGKEDVYPWGKDKYFGNGEGLKIWGTASVATEFKDDSFLIPASSGTDTPSTFDISKFQMVLEYKGVEYTPEVPAQDPVLYTNAEVDEYNAALPGAAKVGDIKNESGHATVKEYVDAATANVLASANANATTTIINGVLTLGI